MWHGALAMDKPVTTLPGFIALTISGELAFPVGRSPGELSKPV
jgi:hypothetical protein